MKKIHLILFIFTLCSFSVNSRRVIDVPKDLLIGVASSSHQIEGAWNEDGKTENIWDRFTHSGNGDGNGDVACDSYHKLEEDIRIIKNSGAQVYRFSLSWARILPTGFSNKINPAGISYYNKLIDQLLAHNITPMVTIYHWDLPQSLQDLGGFANPLIADWLEDFSRIAFANFGDRVKLWITINEPKQLCNFGYGAGDFAPGVKSSGLGEYICAKLTLLAHARVYHLYDKVFKPVQKGKISIVNECPWSEPASNKTEDVEAAERNTLFDIGLYAHPVFHKDGDYPALVKEIVANRSLAEGFSKSRLLELSAAEIEYIKGTYDFYGLIHYTTFMIRHREPFPIGEPSFEKDVQVEMYHEDDWLSGSMSYFRLVPWGVTKMLNYIKDNYENPDIYILESGFPEFAGLEEKNRIKFYQQTLEAVFDAVNQDKVSVKAYIAWSLMDSFEWSNGYMHKFGLYSVDFKDSNRTRTPRPSLKFFKDLIRTQKLKID